MALKSFLTLSRPRSGRVEGRKALIQLGDSLRRQDDEIGELIQTWMAPPDQLTTRTR